MIVKWIIIFVISLNHMNKKALDQDGRIGKYQSTLFIPSCFFTNFCVHSTLPMPPIGISFWIIQVYIYLEVYLLRYCRMYNFMEPAWRSDGVVYEHKLVTLKNSTIPSTLNKIQIPPQIALDSPGI